MILGVYHRQYTERDENGILFSPKLVRKCIKLYGYYYVHTSEGEHFVTEYNADAGNVILSSAANLEFVVKSAEEIFVDGTVRVAQSSSINYIPYMAYTSNTTFHKCLLSCQANQRKSTELF